MSRVMRTTAARRAVFGLALAGLALSSIGNVSAGDLYAPGYYRYPQPGAIDRDRYHAAPPVYRGADVNGGICRIVHQTVHQRS